MLKMEQMDVERRRLWVPLTLGFGTLLALTAAGAVVTLTKSFEIFDQLQSAHENHYRVAESLMKLRSDLYLAGILKRDFLLDRGENQSLSYGQEFAEIQTSADASLKKIESAFAEDPKALARLRAEVTAYMLPLREALSWEPVAAPTLRAYLLRLQLRQRTAALQIAEEIEKLNSEALKDQQQQIASAETDFRKSLLWISLVGLFFGIGIAVFTILYTRRLEDESNEAQAEARRLSQHVVRVQEHERKSISRELHDEVGQMLTGLRMELANLDGPALQADAADHQRLQEAKRLAERTLQCVRNLSMLLRPSMLDDLGLSPAVSWQTKEFSRRSGIPVDLTIEGEVDSVPDEVRTCLYRVVQEALTNVARHARARRIGVVIARIDGRVSAAIEDDGDGFSVLRPGRTHGLGLVGLKERVSELSGKVQITSAPGQGTRVYVQIPVEDAVTC
jgi:signal transduction histidine kinase